MFSVSSVYPQTPHICIPCILYSITLWYPHTSPSRLRHGMQVYCYGMGQSCIYTIYTVSSICPQIPYVCIPCIIYSITLWYPQFTPSRLRHGTQVYYFGMAQSLMYVMPCSHTAAYTPIALPKGTFWSHSRNVIVPPHQCVSVMS